MVTVSRTHMSPYTAEQVDRTEAALMDALRPGYPARFTPGAYLAIGEHRPDEDGSFKFQLAVFKGFSDDDPEWLQVAYLGTHVATAPKVTNDTKVRLTR